MILDGYSAIVAQHECDHLDGMLYPKRMTDLSMLMFSEERRHYAEAWDNAVDEEDTA